MIYSVNESTMVNTDKIALFGEEADNFLESVGVTLYENTIAIGENEYNGSDAEAFLNENGITLYEDHIVLEGQQAEEYKARKAKEKADQKAKEDERFVRRYAPTGIFTGYPGDKDRRYEHNNERTKKSPTIISPTYASKSDDIRSTMATYINSKESDRRYKNFYSKKFGTDEYDKADKEADNHYHNRAEAEDATNRHIRRHPDKYPKYESTIFDFDLK